MIRFNVWAWSPLVVAVVVGALVAGGCTHRTRDGTKSSTSEKGPIPKYVSWDAHFTMSKDGAPRAVIEAPRAEQYQTSDSTYSVWRSMSDTAQVRLYLFGEEGDTTATLTADSLVYQDQKGLLDAYRNVVVVTKENKRLETEHLTWRETDRKIRTRRFVRIRTPTKVVQGNGLVADENLDTYQLGSFAAQVKVDEETGQPGNNE